MSKLLLFKLKMEISNFSMINAMVRILLKYINRIQIYFIKKK